MVWLFWMKRTGDPPGYSVERRANHKRNRLSESGDRKRKTFEYTANIAFAGFTAPKILWVKENEPENFAKICKIMLPKDYLAYRLTGCFAQIIRCFRYASVGCEKQMLVRKCGNLWHYREQLPEAL